MMMAPVSGTHMKEASHKPPYPISVRGEMYGCSPLLPTQTIVYFKEQIETLFEKVDMYITSDGQLTICIDLMNYTLDGQNYQQLGNLLNPNGFGGEVLDERYRQNHQDMAQIIFDAFKKRQVPTDRVIHVKLRGMGGADLESNGHNDSEVAKNNIQCVDRPPFSLLVLAICQFMTKRPRYETFDYQFVLNEVSEIKRAQSSPIKISVWSIFQLNFK